MHISFPRLLSPRPRTGSLLTTAALVLFLAVTAVCAGSAAAEDTPAMNRPRHYLVRLLGTREGWPADMTEREQQVMGEHFAYLKDLTQKKKVLTAGPVMQPVFGLVILQTASEDEARAIMDREPSVVAGVHTYEMAPMTVSLLADYRSPYRYVREPGERKLVKEIEVPASRRDCWHLWTTTEGMTSFLVSEANIDLRPGGPFELYFAADAPPGQRGSEDCKILSYLPEKMLSFEWNAPPTIPTRRDGERTWVVVEFEEIGPESTRVRLTHLGWGDGADWDEVYAYFDKAWGSVLEAMRKHIEATD